MQNDGIYALLFAAINAAVLPAWALLLFVPRWDWTQRLVTAVAVPLLAAVYVALLLFALTTGGGAEGVDFTTMEGVAAIFSHPLGVVTGWAHYLAFDLFVGAWIARDAQGFHLPHILVVPCLLLTFVAGPAGLLLYLVIRAVRGRPAKTAL